MKTATAEQEVVITEKARASLPVALMVSCTGAIVLATAGLVYSWSTMQFEVKEIRVTIDMMAKELHKIGDKVESQPTRREWDEVLARLRALESKRE